jgi:hypothetical protein
VLNQDSNQPIRSQIYFAKLFFDWSEFPKFTGAGGQKEPLDPALGRLGTDVGTDKTCKIVNVYRPWDGGTDKLGISINLRIQNFGGFG